MSPTSRQLIEGQDKFLESKDGSLNSHSEPRWLIAEHRKFVVRALVTFAAFSAER
ncbi:hypothetical protein FHR98_000219 [Limibacillus halophilus]|uniref:Uncharacterized protein n=1 Tax=Limibacillus halophilus TaxID=1579333 RepID=A0A839SQ31_9PROT|nr:hypothetical protein [Limibacillus halophilus]